MSINGRERVRGIENLQYPRRYEKVLREDFLDLWRSYKENAWGYRKIDAISGEGKGGKALPLSMLQALVPLHYFGRWREIRRIQTYVEDNVDPTPNQTLKFHPELGPFLAGLEYLQRLTGSREVYNKMVELGDSLYNNGFDDSTDMVYQNLNPETGESPKELSKVDSLSEGLQSLILLSRITGDSKYEKAVVNCRDAYFNNLGDTGLPYFGYYPTTAEGKYTGISDGIFNGVLQGLVTGYLQTGDVEWLRKAHQMIGEMEDHMLNTEYYALNHIDSDTGEVKSRKASANGVGELPAWLIRVGRPRLAKKFYDTAVNTIIIDGLSQRFVQYANKDVIGEGEATLMPELFDSAEALYRATENEKYLYPVWKVFKACRRYSRKEYGYAQIHPVTKEVTHSSQPEWVLGDSLLSVGYALFSRNPHLQVEKTYRMTWGYPFDIFP